MLALFPARTFPFLNERTHRDTSLALTSSSRKGEIQDRLKIRGRATPKKPLQQHLAGVCVPQRWVSSRILWRSDPAASGHHPPTGQNRTGSLLHNLLRPVQVSKSFNRSFPLSYPPEWGRGLFVSPLPPSLYLFIYYCQVLFANCTPYSHHTTAADHLNNIYYSIIYMFCRYDTIRYAQR